MSTVVAGSHGDAFLVERDSNIFSANLIENGAAEGDVGGAGTLGMVSMPETLGIAGTRGKENNSLIGGNTDAAAGDVPFSPSTK